MSRPLLEYHSLEDGELNRLWYEEQDPRARDAFRIRWWLGGDPIAGKDLITEYHNLFYHRCLKSGVLCEEDQIKVFRKTVDDVVDQFPADPIPKFEDYFIPAADRAINSAFGGKQKADPSTPDADKPAVEKALGEDDAAGVIRSWIAGQDSEASDKTYEAAFEKLKEIARTLDGDEGASFQPIIRIPDPPPSKLDPSVALPNFEARQFFTFAAFPDRLTEREVKHIEWRQACRERCVGTRELLRRLRDIFGGKSPELPAVSPELEDLFQKENPRIPKVDASTAAAGKGAEGRGKSRIAAVVIILALLAMVIMAVFK